MYDIDAELPHIDLLRCVICCSMFQISILTLYIGEPWCR